jgi:cysteine sulfinate desulfinase/cysteine desulfurase-like protein
VELVAAGVVTLESVAAVLSDENVLVCVDVKA